jgi:hypothetical protein
MNRYRDVDGDSGVAFFECGSDYIRVQFRDGHVYLYTYTSAGRQHIERMKLLAATASTPTSINTCAKAMHGKSADNADIR